MPREAAGCCKTRDVLWHLVFAGFVVNYVTRMNLNIAIVSMVKSKPASNLSLTSECLTGPGHIINETTRVVPKDIAALANSTNLTINSSTTSSTFSWNEQQQANILGSFFWLYWVTQIPGGLLASKYGTKLVFGLSNFSGAVCCFFIPLAAYYGHIPLIILRIAQGLLSGFTWPSMHNMAGRWIPPNERSKFVTAYLGSAVGTAITYLACGYIIESWGWEMVFYISGIFGTLWFIAWWVLIYDSPEYHPRISEFEKKYILDSLGKTCNAEKAPIPWVKILTSWPVLLNFLAQWGSFWGFFTLTTHGPTYLKFIQGWDIKSTGFLSGIPHAVRMVWGLICSIVGDYLLENDILSRTKVRKLATALCTIAPGIFIIGLAYSGCNNLMAITFLTLAVALTASVSTGNMACIVDNSPNYAGIILGIINTAAAIGGFLTPVTVGYFTLNNQTVSQWEKVFWISSMMMIVPGILYVVFASADLQSWNSPKESRVNDEVLEKMMSGCVKEGDCNRNSNADCKATGDTDPKYRKCCRRV